MSIYPRILGLVDPKIPVDLLSAWIGEVQNGTRTQAQMNTYFAFDATETTEITAMMAKVGTGQGRIQPLDFRNIVEIAEYPQPPYDANNPLGLNNPYGTVATLKARLGVA